MVVMIILTAGEGRGDEGGDEKQGKEIPPLEDIEPKSTGVERTVLGRFLGEFVDAFCYADYGEDTEDGGWEGED
jgi:hypothetical protein